MRGHRRTSRLVRGLLAVAAIAVGASVAGVSASARRAARAPWQDGGSPQEGDLATVGATVVEQACGSQCHGLDSLAERRTARDWKNVVQEMVDRGASASADDLAIVTRYLTRYRGLVAVNSATAEELSAVLGLSPKEAQAIVDYRTAHGKFTDAAALAKVPGIDLRKLDEQAMTFS